MRLTTLITAVLLCTSMNAIASAPASRLHHHYDRDASGRITTRTAYAWNGNEWQPALRWTYTYTPTGYIVELSRYDSRHRCFGEPTDKTVCLLAPDCATAIVTTYERTDNDTAFIPTDTMLAKYHDKARQQAFTTNNQ